MYLFDEQPIIPNKALARVLGLNEALVLQQINYWIEINKKSGKNYHDEKYWTYNSIRWIPFTEDCKRLSCHERYERYIVLI